MNRRSAFRRVPTVATLLAVLPAAALGVTARGDEQVRQGPGSAVRPATLDGVPLPFSRVINETSQGGRAVISAVNGEARNASSSRGAPLALRRPPDEAEIERAGRGSKNASRAAATVCGSLAIVLGSFLLLVWVTRRAAPKRLTPLPTEVIESLGRSPLGARQHMQLVRLGKRLLLLCVTPQGAETLAEVTDPDEVDRLAALCQRSRQGSASTTFHQVLSQFAAEPAPGGFLGNAVANVSGSRSRRAS